MEIKPRTSGQAVQCTTAKIAWGVLSAMLDDK